MRGESLDEARVTPTGLEGDRVYAFVDPGKRLDFPWLSAREVPEMLLFTPRFAGGWKVSVVTPEGKTRDLQDPAFLDELRRRWGRPFELRFSERGMPDSGPVSILGLDSARALEPAAGQALDCRRFRANLYVAWDSRRAFFEDEWVGRELRLGGGPRLRVLKRDPRCVIINLDPDTAAADPGTLMAVGRERQGRLGVYAEVLEPGTVRPGDAIEAV